MKRQAVFDYIRKEKNHPVMCGNISILHRIFNFRDWNSYVGFGRIASVRCDLRQKILMVIVHENRN